MQSLKDQEVLKAHLDELQKQVTSLKWELGAARDANKLYQQQRKIAEQIACAKQKQVVSLQQQNVQKEKRAELSTFKPAQGFNKAKILKYTMGAVMGAVGLGLVLSNLYNRSRSITGVTATEKAQGVMRDARHLVHMVGNAVGESLPGNPLTTHPRVGEKLGEVGRDLFELGSMIIRAASPEVVTATIVPAVGLVASSVLRKESPMPDFVMMGADNKQAL
jgi:hypothetical protein